ncbi:AAA family ATPase [Georgenia alba]|uniref:Nuclease SbcCD subunit C n=1 Tax=Georgenia alba TaxID=2233858 RepID=A0ABW2QA89_9MICO
MRIHRLTVQAIGPFPGRHTIDLEELAAGGLFLLEGPTGAGKSTLLDAIVFALYGTVGAESSDDRLHSDHADPGVEPFVELVFSTGAGTFRVWRSPKHERPKRRGDGVTVQNARAKLWRLAGDSDVTPGVPVSAHVQEVGDELARIVVLDRAQFTQTVVLPQGQFAAFLRARPEDRRSVLQEVFGTEIYDRLQQRLAEMARQARETVHTAHQEVVSAADALARAAHGGEDPAPGRGAAPAAEEQTGRAAVASLREAAAVPDGDRLRKLAEQVCELWADRERRDVERRDACAAAESAARALLDSARELASRLARRADLEAAEHRLREDREAVEDAVARLDLARRAAPIGPLLDEVDRAVARDERAAAAREQAAVAASGHGLEDLTEPEAVRAALEEATTTLGWLEPLATIEEALPARARAVREARAEADAATRRTAELAAQVDARPAARQALVSELDRYRDAGSRRERARVAQEQAYAVLRAAQDAEATEAEVTAAKQRLEQAARDARGTLDAEHEVRRRWVAGMAGALAAELEPGRPCAVCGATEHPDPARATDEHAADEDVAAAERARAEADGLLTEARSTHTEVTTRLAGLRQAAGGASVAAAEEALDRAEAAFREAEAAVIRHAELDHRLAEHDAETGHVVERLGAARAADAARAERLEAQVRRLAEDEERCAEARGEHASVVERAERLRGRARAARRLADATAEVRTAREARADAAARLRERLDAVGLEDPEAARAALLPETEAASLADLVERHRAEATRVAQGLAEPELADLDGRTTPDVAAAEAAHADAMADLTRAAGAASEAALRCRQTLAAAERLTTAVQAHIEAAGRAAPVLRTAALATAGEGNTIDTTLATYVLLRRFEDVVAAANDRLATMSDGRYALERIDEREGGQRSRKAGLGLRVRDQVTETPRDPHTLSGGETFYVSLCLALGLADVVRSEAGGIELGTLFVDEGFGSLDPETLDAVMTELSRLREGGRAVGVVSHVSEMKDRIPDRVSIRREPSGASTVSVRR